MKWGAYLLANVSPTRQLFMTTIYRLFSLLIIFLVFNVKQKPHLFSFSFLMWNICEIPISEIFLSTKTDIDQIISRIMSDLDLEQKWVFLYHSKFLFRLKLIFLSLRSFPIEIPFFLVMIDKEQCQFFLWKL